MRNRIKTEKSLVLVGLFSLALAVRLVGLGGPCFSAEEVRWLIGWRCGFSCLFDFLSRADQPPLAYLLIRLWGLVSHAEWWMRLLPALASAGAVVFAYLLVELKVTRPTALLAAFLLALSPMAVRAGQDLSALSLTAFFVTASAYYAAIWLGTHGERGKAATAVFAVLALYTHYFAWFYLIFLFFAFLSTAIHPGFRRSYAYAPLAAVLISLIPWLPVLHRQVGDVTRLFSTVKTVSLLFETLVRSFFGTSPHAPAFPSPPSILYVITLLLLALVIWGALRHPFLGLLFFAPLLTGAAVRVFAPVFEPRFMAVFLPAGLACLAAGIGEISRLRLPGKALAGFLGILVIGLYLAVFAADRMDAGQRLHNTDWRLTEFYFPKNHPGEFVVGYSAEALADLAYYLPRGAAFVPLAQNDLAALRLGPEGLADEAGRFAKQLRGVVFVDRGFERFDPDKSAPAAISGELGKPIMLVPLNGSPHGSLWVFPARSILDAKDLFWLFKWPRPWRAF